MSDPLFAQSTSWSLPPDLEGQVSQELEDWQREDRLGRLWRGDAGLWTGTDESEWLGWLRIDKGPGDLSEMAEAAEQFKDCVLLGMGGSSLCPEVLSLTFGRKEGCPAFHVLDSTDPAHIRSLAGKIDPASTLVIVSSKSGSTLETNIFLSYFQELVTAAVGPDLASKRFIAITDPGSSLEAEAERLGFLDVAYGVPSIGGRFSALSMFGLLPAAIMGIDLATYVEAVSRMVKSCSVHGKSPGQHNPGLILGILLGVAGRNGRDKVTLLTSAELRDFGSWLEQLLAESTGKDGKGLIPVDLEAPGSPDVYGSDRLFVSIGLTDVSDPVRESAVRALERAGHPVVRIEVEGIETLGAEFYRWEFATAVAGSILGINPFNQPDVEASKIETRKLTSLYEETGGFPEETPFFGQGGIGLFTDDANIAAIRGAAGADPSLAELLRGHLSRAETGDYVALLAYLERNEAIEATLTAARQMIRDGLRVATCVGFGPRFLHSTGQVYKGGPDTGVFLQLTCDDKEDLPIPGRGYTFGVVKAAQARGDFQVLVDRGRRALRIHLGPDVEAGLGTFENTIREALA